MEHLCSNLMEKYDGEFHKVNLFSELKENLTKEARGYCISEAEKYRNFVFPHISATMFMKFKRTGNRVDFEDVYFQKRRVLNALVLGEFIEGEGRFLDDIINGIFSICEESGWQLPPHNSYYRDTEQLLLPDSEHPVMDLFACETGAQLATIYHLLKDALDEVSPFVCDRIMAELEKRIIKPYLQEHFWWMGNGDEPMCNWTIWCTQNVLLTASQIPLEADIYEAIVRKASMSTDYFLKEYGIDGCCDEGAQYYRHAGLCLFLTLHLLNEICEDSFVSVFENEKIRNIAEYICNVHVEDVYYINFADCSPIAGRAGIREYLFGKAIQSAPLCSFAALDFVADPARYQPDEINLSYRLLTLQHESEVLAYAAAHPKQLPANNVWYESVGIFMARTAETCLAVKAGDNDDSHNHNDTGSIILYHEGKPVLIDIGVESYTKKTFSPRRYEIWAMQSGYHNLPTIGGCDQLPGADFHATNVISKLAPSAHPEELSTIELDLQEAYPQSCQVLSYNRRVILEPGVKNVDHDCTQDVNDSYAQEINKACVQDVVTLTDTYAFDKDATDTSVILNFMTYEKPAFKDNILTIGSLYAFDISGNVDYQMEEIPITDARLQTAWKHEVYRVRFMLHDGSFTMKTHC